MFAGIKRFICRHRRKLIIGGVVIGGFVFATHYAQRKLRDWQEREMKDLWDRTQRQQHFEKNERTCNQTILSLTPSLCDTVGKLLDPESLLEKLRSGSSDKVALWEELKIVSFTRLSVLLYSGTLFVVLLRVQVNLIGGYMYHRTISETNGTCELDKKLQEDYLKLCQHFLTKGVKDLCSLIENKVRFILEGESLKKKLTLEDIEHYFWAIQSAISTGPEDPLSQLSRYLLPPALVDEVRGNKGTAMYNIVSDTLEIIETSEVRLLATSCISCGFAKIMDSISEFYIPSDALALPGTSDGFQNRITDLKKATLPMAKIVPIVNGLTNVAKSNGTTREVYEQWIQQFISVNSLKVLGANIYESFSNHSS